MQGGAANRASAVVLGAAALALRVGRRGLTVKTIANDLHISCRPPSPRPHQPTFHIAFTERTARTEPGASAACRLHALVRRRRRCGNNLDTVLAQQLPAAGSAQPCLSTALVIVEGLASIGPLTLPPAAHHSDRTAQRYHNLGS